jgi:hypothetical protein
VSSARGRALGHGRVWDRARARRGILLLVPPLGALGTAAATVDHDTYQLLVREDGIYEWTQVGLALVGAVLAVVVAARLRQQRRRGLALLWAVGAVALVALAGEEIAWGQRVFDLETPSAIAARNDQDEITIHNTSGAGLVSASVLLAVCSVGIVGPLVTRRFARGVPADVLASTVPPGELVAWFAVLPAWKLVRVLHHVVGDPAASDYTEYGELCLVAGIALFALARVRALAPGTADEGARRVGTPHHPPRACPIGVAMLPAPSDAQETRCSSTTLRGRLDAVDAHHPPAP